MSLWDKASQKIQESTGEAERKRLVQKIKEEYIELRRKITEGLNKLNTIINNINSKIKHLNSFRTKNVEPTVKKLENFLNKFGNAKNMGEYAPEKECPPMIIKEHNFEVIENYISEIDWTKEDVFNNTLFLTPLGATLKTKKQNILLNESLVQLKFVAESTLKEMQARELNLEQEKKITNLYCDCVEYIISIINTKIIPEMELIEDFFAAIVISDFVVASQNNHVLSSNIDIKLLQNTKYHKHYVFLKNTFMFYIMSCKIYNTPVLTHLLNSCIDDSDEHSLSNQKELLLDCGAKISSALMIERKNI